MCWSLYLLLSFLFLRASLVAQRVKNLPLMWETRVWSLGWEAPLEKEMAYPLQYSYLENPMHRGAWRTTIPGVSKNQTWLSDWHFHFFHFFVPQTSSGNKHRELVRKQNLRFCSKPLWSVSVSYMQSDSEASEGLRSLCCISLSRHWPQVAG